MHMCPEVKFDIQRLAQKCLIALSLGPLSIYNIRIIFALQVHKIYSLNAQFVIWTGCSHLLSTQGLKTVYYSY